MYRCPNAATCRYGRERKVGVALDDGADMVITLPACSHSVPHMHNDYCGSTCPPCEVSDGRPLPRRVYLRVTPASMELH
jgi:hypothetical protein